MNLVRAAGRAMLATFFIANGVRTFKDPDAFVAAAEPLAEKFVPLAQKAFPEAIAAYVPEDTKTLVRINGVLSIIGGVGMATGIAPRMGGALAAASMIPHVIASNPLGADDKVTARSIFVRNLALTGAAIVLTQDTHGKPSMLWQANTKATLLGKSAAKTVDTVQADASKLGRRAQKRLDRAARKVSKRLAFVADDYDKLGRGAKRSFDRATSDARGRFEAAAEAVADALK